MKPVAFDYLCPTRIEDALAALAEGGDSVRLLAGGQSLGPMLNLRLARPAIVVDLQRIPALREIRREATGWHVGAMATHATLEDDAAALGGMVPFVARRIAWRAIRNRGTIGGSLAHADPAGDWPLALAALGATVVIARRGASAREIAVESLSTGAFRTVLGTDEMIVGVRVPALAAEARWSHAKTTRKAGELADAAAAVVIDPARRFTRIALGALGRPPVLVAQAQALLAPGVAQDLARCEDAVGCAAPELDALDRRLQAATLSRAIRMATGSP